MTEKCAVERRGYPPGQHGQSRKRRATDYSAQLREKQKLRRMYGIQERQFRGIFERAERQTGVTLNGVWIMWSIGWALPSRENRRGR